MRPPVRLDGRARLALGALAALLAAVLLQGRIEARAAERPAASPLLYLPSGRYLGFVALGFDGILADLIYLWSIQYYGNYAIQDRYDYLDHIYGQVITELDPRYLDPYLVGALIMDVEAGRPDMALRLLDKGIAANPDTWVLAFEAGFLCYQRLGDYERARAYFERALRAPDVHPLVRRMHAAMIARSGDTRTALREWAEIWNTSEDPYVRTVAAKHVHDLKVEIDLQDLRAALAAWRSRHGRWPRRLEQLVAAGLLARLPRDPEDRGYRYDPATGEAGYAGALVLAR
jgi:tetratricopeptide (TPR) repeat protein